MVELAGRALLPGLADDIVVVVHDDEPTSIIAYFLSTRQAQSPSCVLIFGLLPCNPDIMESVGNST